MAIQEKLSVMHMCSSSAARRLFTTHSHCCTVKIFIDLQTSPTSSTPCTCFPSPFGANEHAPLVACLTPFHSSIWDTTPRALIRLHMPVSYRTLPHVCDHLALPLPCRSLAIHVGHVFDMSVTFPSFTTPFITPAPMRLETRSSILSFVNSWWSAGNFSEITSAFCCPSYLVSAPQVFPGKGFGPSS